VTQAKKTKKCWYGSGTFLVRFGGVKNHVFYDVFEKVGTVLVRFWYVFGTVVRLVFLVSLKGAFDQNLSELVGV
jgi:hypothetical protein